MPKSNDKEYLQEMTLQLTTDIVAAYIANNQIQAISLPDLIYSVHVAVDRLARGETPISETNLKPAVPIKKSITPDYLVCLEDGKQLKMLKRYLRTRFSMTPAEYRAKWNLPPEYPMVAPNYAEKRSQFAKEIGLGKTAKRKK